MMSYTLHGDCTVINYFILALLHDNDATSTNRNGKNILQAHCKILKTFQSMYTSCKTS